MELVESISVVEALCLRRCCGKIDHINCVNQEEESHLNTKKAPIMSGMKIISLKIAESIADTAIRTAMSRNYAPITVVVLDSWGHTVVSKRMDGCAPVGLHSISVTLATDDL